jgi:hypothetical protein
VALAQKARHGGRFHELGTVADYGEYAHYLVSERSMIGSGLTQTLLSGAAAVLAAGRGAADHAAWWVSYQVEGTTHDDDRPLPAEEPAEESA